MKRLQSRVILSFLFVWGGFSLFANLSLATLDVLNCGDSFFDNGGDTNNYQNEITNETVTICPQISGEVVVVNFTQFELENNGDNCYDELMIFNGDDVTHPVIASPHGTTKGWCWDKQAGSEGGSGNLEGMTLTSTDDSGCLTFVFNSDGLINRLGWEASVTCVLPPTCPAHNNLLANNITDQAAELYWQNGGGINQSNTILEWGMEGFSLGNGTNISVSENSFQLLNLSPSTTYQFYIQNDCSADGASAWVGPHTFTTSCAPFQGDSFDDPLVINSLPYEGQVNTNDCFTNQIGTTGPDAFYTFTTSNCADFIVFTTCSATSDFDTYIRLLDADGNELATNDDAESACDFNLNGEFRFSEIHYDVNPNNTYTAVLEGFGLESGNVGFEIFEESIVDSMTVFSFVNDVSCYGETDGSIISSIEGGITPLIAEWDSGHTGFNPTDLTPGVYKILVKDACGQMISETYEIVEPEIVEVATLASAETYSGQNDGSVECLPSGGTAPYSYEWNNNEETATIQDLSVGQYCVTVTDAMGCTASSCDLVLAGTTSTNEIEGLTKLQLAPNPVSEIAMLQIEFSTPKEISIEMYSSVGELLYVIKNERIKSKTYPLNVSDFPAGIYFIRVNSEAQQVVKRLIVK